MKNLADRALEFATKAHEGQLKYDAKPYIAHSIAVAQIICQVSHSEEMTAAAYLHDVVEKCAVSLEEIDQKFGHAVHDLVWWLTKPPANRTETPSQLERRHLQKAPASAKTIKLADIIDNVETLKAHKPDAVFDYSQEKCELLEALREGDTALWRIANTALGCEPRSCLSLE